MEVGTAIADSSGISKRFMNLDFLLLIQFPNHLSFICLHILFHPGSGWKSGHLLSLKALAVVVPSSNNPPPLHFQFLQA